MAGKGRQAIPNTGKARQQELDFDQPVVNIGCDPENDITITGSGVLPFHAAVVMQNGEYRLISLDPHADIRLDGVPVDSNVAVLTEDQQIDLAGYSLMIKHNGTPTSMHVLLRQPVVPEVTAPAAESGTMPPAPQIWIPALGENVILANVLSKMLEIDVEQTASVAVEVINAGPIVAGFTLSVDGIPEEWVEISPSVVNLNEGQRATITVRITPPRAPTSTAGKHPLALEVTSPNYPGHASRVETELTINPYYDFLLGNLTPRQQNIAWRKHVGRVSLAITNQGNSDAAFDVMALDEENACSFDFLVPDGRFINRQTTVNVPAGMVYDLPIDITPNRQPIIAMRNRRYQYTTNVQVAQQAASPQSMSGSVVSQPLFGWWSIVLSVVALLLLIFIIIQPNINSFQVNAGKDVIELGDSTALEWSVSPFATRLSISNIDKSITRDLNHITISPTQSTSYELVASNWLASMLGLERKRTITVLVVPPSPEVTVFDVDKTRVKKGLPVKLRWSVGKADKAVLTIADVAYELPAEQFSGEKEVTLEKDALVTLEAKSASGSELRSYFINVVPPSIDITAFNVWTRPKTKAALLEGGMHLALPTRQTDFSQMYVGLVPDSTTDTGYKVKFYQPDRELDKGEQIMVEWEVEGAEALQVAPFTQSLPVKGNQPYFPQESMNFTMTAKSGELQLLQMLPVTVFDGQPPVAPTIDFFKASPSALVGSGDVQFAWSISGEWTKVTLNMGETVIADNLQAQGFKTVTVSKTSTFILTAWNGTLSKAETLEVVVNPALKSSTLTVDDVSPHATYFRVGDTVSVTVSIVGLDQTTATPDPTGKITVTDGFSVCAITLPLKSCNLTFTSAGTKQIKASYSGDTVYLPTDSPIYTKDVIIVDANKVTLDYTFSSVVYSTDANGNTLVSSGKAYQKRAGSTTDLYDLRIGQGLYVNITVMATNKPIEDKNGQITVRYCPEDSSGNRIETACITAGPSTVTASDLDKSIGSASVVISHFLKKGRYSVVISYKHTTNAFEPALIGNTAADKIEVMVDNGQILLIPQTTITDPVCTSQNCVLMKATPGTVIFDARLMMDDMGDVDPTNDQMADLYSNYPQPVSMGVTSVPQSTPAASPTYWTCTWQKSNSKYQLVCPSVMLTEPLTVTYQFEGSGDTNYTVYKLPNPLKIQIRYPSSFEVTPGLFSNLYAGKTLEIQKGNIVLTQEGAPITPSDFVLSVENDSIENYIGVKSTSACALDTASHQLKITQSNTASDSCVIYFKKAVPTQLALTLVLSYKGDVSHSAVTLKFADVAVQKQTGLQVTWNTDPDSVDVFSDLAEKLTFSCNNSTTCGPTADGFAYEVLSNATLQLGLSAYASNCTVTGTNLSSNLLTLPALPADSGAPQEMLTFNCTTPGYRSVSAQFTGTSADSFGVSTGGTHGITFNTVSVSLNVTVTQNSETTNLVTGSPAAITTLTAGDSYWLYFTLSNVPAGVTLDSKTELLKMTVPNLLPSRIAAADSSCKPDATDNTVYSFTLSKIQDTPPVWASTKCSIRLSSAGPIGTPTNLAFALTSTRFTLGGTTTVNIPQVTSRSGAIYAEVRKVDSADSAAYSLIGYGPSTADAGKVNEFYPGEDYLIRFELGLGSAVTATYFHPLIDVPDAFYSALETDTQISTCLKYPSASTTSAFSPPWESNTNYTTFTASCKVRFKNAVTLPANSKIDFGLTFEYWFDSISWNMVSISIPSVTKAPVTLTASLTPAANAGATNWWITTSTALNIQVADTHYRLNAIDTMVPNLTVQMVDSTNVVRNAKLTCAKVDASSIACTPDSSYAFNGSITVSYAGDTNFAAATATTVTYNLKKFNTQIELSDVYQVTDSTTGALAPFPPLMHCLGDPTASTNPCSMDSPKELAHFRYMLASTNYNLAVLIRIPETDLLVNGVHPSPDIGTITVKVHQTYVCHDPSFFPWLLCPTGAKDGDTITRVVSQASGIVQKATITTGGTTEVVGKAVMTSPISLSAGYVAYGYNYNYTVSYTDASGKFMPITDGTVDSSLAWHLHLRKLLVPTVEEQDNNGFHVTALNYNGSPLSSMPCLRVYFEAATIRGGAMGCEDKTQACWPLTANSPEKMALWCSKDDGDYAGGDTTNDGIIKTGDYPFNPTDPAASYQLFILNSEYIGYKFGPNWPPPQ